MNEELTTITQQVYRNCMYYAISVSPSKVLFVPHHGLTGSYRVVYECSVENWNAGNLFGNI